MIKHFVNRFTADTRLAALKMLLSMPDPPELPARRHSRYTGVSSATASSTPLAAPITGPRKSKMSPMLRTVAMIVFSVLMSSAVAAQTPLTATTQTPISGWTCIPHPYPILAAQGWLFCWAPSANTMQPGGPDGSSSYRLGVPGDLLATLGSQQASAGALTYTNAFDFPEVPLGQPGEDNDFRAIVLVKNKTAIPAIVTLVVTKVGEAPIARSYELGPHERRDPVLNEWPELQGFVGGVTLEVKIQHAGTAGVVVRSDRDFWRAFTVLQGQRAQ